MSSLASALFVAALATSADGVATPQAEFESISRDVRALWRSDACFGPPWSAAISKMDACWAAQPERADVARAQTHALVARLDAVQDSYPARSVVLKTKLNLFTRSALFCEERDLAAGDRALIAAQADMFREWAGALDMCARTTEDAVTYDVLRGALASNVRRYSKADRIELLKIWFNSFLFQHSPNGDLTRAAAALNTDDLLAWKTFVAALRRDVGSWQRFPADSVSAGEMDAARTALYAA